MIEQLAAIIAKVINEQLPRLLVENASPSFWFPYFAKPEDYVQPPRHDDGPLMLNIVDEVEGRLVLLYHCGLDTAVMVEVNGALEEEGGEQLCREFAVELRKLADKIDAACDESNNPEEPLDPNGWVRVPPEAYE
jgi:hypothetical protein